MNHIFFSYAHENTEVMHRFRDSLRETGILDIWTDEDLDIDSPQWEPIIEEKIKEALCVVVLLTPEAKKSKWVARELTIAEDYFKIPFLPVLVEGNERTSIPPRLVNHERIEVRASYEKAALSLQKAINNSPYAEMS